MIQIRLKRGKSSSLTGCSGLRRECNVWREQRPGGHSLHFSLLNGSTVGKYDDKDDRVDLRLSLSNQGRNRANMLQQVYVPSSREGNGQTLLVPLSQIAIRQYAAGSSDTRRYDRQKEIRLTANTVGTSMGQAVDAVFDKVSEIQVPDGCFVGTAGVLTSLYFLVPELSDWFYTGQLQGYPEAFGADITNPLLLDFVQQKGVTSMFYLSRVSARHFEIWVEEIPRV